MALYADARCLAGGLEAAFEVALEAARISR